MEPAEVRRRATRGAAVLGLRTLTIRGLTFASSVVLARLLSPRDFGIIAFGASLVTLAGLLADGGIGIGLIRGVREPDELDLGTMLGLQLGGSVLLAVLVSGIALRFGEPGRITAVLSLSIPLSALSTPGSIIMERQLAYGTLALVETLGVLTYAGWSVVSVVLGAGVWGLATAMVLGPAVQSVATLAAVPRGRVRPRLVRSRARQLLAFGVRFQGAGLADMARDQGINIGTASIVGVGTLGVWSLVTRLLQAPFSLLEVTGRVAYPMMARLLAAGEDPADELERMMAVIGLCVGLLIAGLVGTGPVFTVVAFGAKWESAVAALPWVGFAFVLNSPVAVVLGGYLYARGEAGAVLRANIYEAVVWVAVALALLPALGVQAIGIGMLAGTIFDVYFYRSAVRQWARVRVMRALGPALACTGLASVAGWFTASALSPTPAAVLAAGSVATIVYAATTVILSRPALAHAVRLGSSSLKRR